MASKMTEAMISDLIGSLQGSSLFSSLSEEEIRACLNCTGAEYTSYSKGEYIFSEGDAAEKLTMLVYGAITLGRHSIDGKREITALLERSGDVFGLEQLFAEDPVYDFFARAQTNTAVLRISSTFLKQTCDKNCGFHSRLIFNTLQIMAKKALDMNEQIEIMSGSSLRERIFKYLMFNCGPDNTVNMTMSRQELADYLNAARPSVSRELMKMQDEGLIAIRGRIIEIIRQNRSH